MKKRRIPIHRGVRSGYTGIIFLLIMLMATGACTRKKKISGSEFVERDVMVGVILDMHLVDGVTNNVAYYRKYEPGDSIDLYSPVFDKYGITREKFDRTLEEYSNYPYLLDGLYDEVIMRLNVMQDELDEERRRRDSIRRNEKEES